MLFAYLLLLGLQDSLSLAYLQFPVVQVHAVAAVEFLQEPDPNCPMTSAWLNLLAKD